MFLQHCAFFFFFGPICVVFCFRLLSPVLCVCLGEWLFCDLTETLRKLPDRVPPLGLEGGLGLRAYIM